MKIKLLCVTYALAAVLFVGSAFGTAQAAQRQQLITVMNPAIAGKLAKRLPLSPRLHTLKGKTIYMVDNQWGGPQGAYQLFEEIQAWFKVHMPSVKVVLRRTKDNMFGDDPALWKEIKEKGDAAIIGTGQ